MKTWLCVLAAVAAAACGSTIETTGTSSSSSSSGTAAGGSGASASSTSGSGGIASFDCEELRAEYAAEIANARVCNPALDVEQCTLEIGGDLICQCPSFVNPVQSEEIDRLRAIASEYESQGCNPGVVCDCAAPTAGRCQPVSGSAGACEDVY